MNNRLAEVESFVDHGVDKGMVDAAKEDLAVASNLTMDEWKQYMAHYGKLRMDTSSIDWLKSGCVTSWAFKEGKRDQKQIDAAYSEMWDRPGAAPVPVVSDKPLTTKEAAFLTCHEVGLENMKLQTQAFKAMPGSKCQKDILAQIAANNRSRRKARLSRS